MRNLLIVDLEATCWEKGQPHPPLHKGWSRVNEIIEVGAVLVNAYTLETKEKFQSFVRPRYYPNLSNFCTGLTGITQAQIDEAPDLMTVMMEFVDRFNIRGNSEDPIFCSWGRYDRDQLWSDCIEKCSLPYPFQRDNHLNLKFVLCNAINTRRRGLKKVMTRLNLEFEGQHHSGIDDAINTAHVLRAVVNRTGINIQNF